MHLQKIQDVYVLLSDSNKPVFTFGLDRPDDSLLQEMIAEYGWCATLPGVKIFDEAEDASDARSPMFETYREDEDLTFDIKFDEESLAKAVETDEGWLRCQGLCARSGCQVYSSGVDYRPDSEVFAEATLRSLELVPLTLGHPPKLLNPSTAALKQVGSVGNPKRVKLDDADYIKCDILITDKDAIADVKAGKLGLSAGYTAKIVPFKGIIQHTGEKFDSVQKDIRLNHVAIVRLGRAGPKAKIMLDEKKEEKIQMDENKEPAPALDEVKLDATPKAQKSPMPDVMLGKVAALEAIMSSHDDRLKVLEAKYEEQKSLKQDAASAPEDLEKVLLERFDLAVQVAPTLGKEIKELVKMDSIEIMRQVVAKLNPSADLKDASKDYVKGFFESSLKVQAERKNPVAQIAQALSGKSIAMDSAESARERMIARTQGEWLAPRGPIVAPGNR